MIHPLAWLAVLVSLVAAHHELGHDHDHDHHDHHHQHGPSAVDLTNGLKSLPEEQLGKWKLGPSWCAKARFEGAVTGWVKFKQDGDQVLIRGDLKGLSPGLHGLHIHNNGDVSASCANVGPHYDPHNTGKHGGRDDPERHAGDLGNIMADGEGRARFFLKDDLLEVKGERTIVGRSVGVDQHEDTFQEDHDDSVPPIACALIRSADKGSSRSHVVFNF